MTGHVISVDVPLLFCIVYCSNKGDVTLASMTAATVNIEKVREGGGKRWEGEGEGGEKRERREGGGRGGREGKRGGRV